MLLVKISNTQKSQFKMKPWITPGLANSIKIKKKFRKTSSA